MRIDRIPGKSTVGIEVPNDERATIVLRELLESAEYTQSNFRLPLALGKDIRGKNIVADLQKMPHLLAAGSTGTGKSVSINTMILSLLFHARPDQVKLIMIDPKRLELGLYQDIPHLLVPVVTEPKVAQQRAALGRHGNGDALQEAGDARRPNTRGLQRPGEAARHSRPEPQTSTARNRRSPLPYIVIVIDELADLMMTAAREVEESITRLAQMARAVGIHLILATQRPSVDVITGLIKANFPARISFRTTSKVDSRTILDSNGAEQLLGRGDMLFMPPGSSRLMRVHGSLVTEEEVTKVVNFLKAQGKPVYNERILEAAGRGARGRRRNATANSTNSTMTPCASCWRWARRRLPRCSAACASATAARRACSMACNAPVSSDLRMAANPAPSSSREKTTSANSEERCRVASIALLAEEGWTRHQGKYRDASLDGADGRGEFIPEQQPPRLQPGGGVLAPL